VSWQQYTQTANAQKIAEAAREFYSRVVIFTRHFDKIHSGLQAANEAFNDAVASFEMRVRPAGERLAELGGAVEGKELSEIALIEGVTPLPPAATN
jgi:DNA anti-recombination protein RmuC